jgi:hypothetical protein
MPEAVTITSLQNAAVDVAHISDVANSSSTTATDRLGTTKKTVAGWSADMASHVAAVESAKGTALTDIAADVSAVESSKATALTDIAADVSAVAAEALDAITNDIPLAVATVANINSRGAWAAATAYALKDIVLESGTWYQCVVAHTSSGAFATDSASKWRVHQGLVPVNLTLLNNGSTSHTDGTDTLVGSARYFLGNATPSTDDSALLIGRSLTGSYFSGAHAVRDETAYNSSGTGLHAYASFDAIPALSGSAVYNHLHAFQARPQYSGSGSMGAISCFTAQAHVAAGSGTVALNHGIKISNPTGTGPITNNYAIWVDPQTRGTNNFSFYSSGSQQFYNGGVGQFGGALTIAGALTGATTGAFSSQVTAKACDATGTPASFTSAGGVNMSYSGSGTGVVRAYANVAGGGTAQLNLMGGSTLVAQAFSTGVFAPGSASSTSLGNSSWKWSEVFAVTGTINTSDARHKQQVRDLSEQERAVALRCKGLIRAFKFNEAVEKKGNGARIHVGVIAQDVKAAFEAEGLDGFEYAVLCYDEWDDKFVDHPAVVEEIPAVYSETIVGEDGKLIEISPASTRLVHPAWTEQTQEAGNAYGVRYEQLLAFIIAAL